MKNFWLLKSEASCYSIDDMKKDGTTAWTGIRNYQARNFIKNEMKVGDSALFYHSSSESIGVAGMVTLVKGPYGDATALDPKDEHYDPKSTKTDPIWYCVDVKFEKKFPHFVTLDEIKFSPKLSGIMVTQKGSRLSVQPVQESHFKEILRLGGL